MANSSLTLSSLDFDSLKANFKEFLKTQSVFKDYDFDGSNINVLLDVMSYNSYLNAFYLNMIASEMFLDTALKYDSVVSHAKELNYVPRSKRSSIAEINVVFTAESNIGKLIIPKGTRFSGLNSNNSYTFTTNETTVLVSPNTTFTANNLRIYEGNYFTDSFVIDYDIESQLFVLSNENIDTNSITVNVLENNGADNNVFNRAESLFGLSSNSQIYFLQAAQNNKFEIVFGDNLFGRKPQNGAVIRVEYRVSEGVSADGVQSFDIADDVNLVNQSAITTQSITTVSVSTGGAEAESTDSIRFSAPRYFATQQRAISNDDYASLVLTNFGGEISDVAIYGGQDLEPKQYGRVVVCLKPANGIIAPNFIKNKISNFLLPYIAIPNRIIISDPEYLYCSVDTQVQYDSILGEKNVTELGSLIYATISNYSKNSLEKFGADLRYSKLISTIDNTDTNIVSNNTEVRLIKKISPMFDTVASFDIETNNKIYVEPNSDKIGTDYNTRYLYSSLISSKFTYNYLGAQYPLSHFEDDNNGNIYVYYTLDNVSIKLTVDPVGSIDYVTGRIILSNIRIFSYDKSVSLFLKPYNKDIFANKNKIILIDPSDVNVNITEVLT